jgi:hypothetical protein
VTTLQPIITQGYRELNLVAVGKSPSPLQVDEGLLLLLNVIDVTICGDAGENLRDWPLGDFGRQPLERYNLALQCYQNPRINCRLIATNEQAMTVYLPVKPSDGTVMAIVDPFNRLSAVPVTLDGNGRTIEGGQSVLLDLDGTDRKWLYRADLGTWVRLTELAIGDKMPFPKTWDFFFSIELALRLSGRSGRAITAATATVYKKLRERFVNKYLQSDILDREWSFDREFMSTQAYQQGWDSGSTVAFNEGGAWPW